MNLSGTCYVQRRRLCALTVGLPPRDLELSIDCNHPEDLDDETNKPIFRPRFANCSCCRGRSGTVSGERRREGENRDRSNLALPGVQEELILEIAATGTPVVVVLVTGGAVVIGKWIDKVQAVLTAWYPGEEGGHAIADVLMGHHNPAGRLPITFPRRMGQLPLYYSYKPSGRGSDYVDLRGEQALFPFGYGLSYTTFRYSNLKITPKAIAPGGSVLVSVDVRNSGKRKGDEVVQLYLSDRYGSVSRPNKELKGFARITLRPGQKKTVQFELTERELRFLDKHLEYVVEPGTFEVMVGGSSTTGLRGAFKVT